MSTSKSAPGLPVFNDFDFQIAFARRRGANFVDILGNRSFATPVFRTYLCELSKRQNYGKTQHFAQFLPAKTSLLSNIDAARATGNFQYSRKLELLNFLWQVSKNSCTCEYYMLMILSPNMSEAFHQMSWQFFQVGFYYRSSVFHVFPTDDGRSQPHGQLPDVSTSPLSTSSKALASEWIGENDLRTCI